MRDQLFLHAHRLMRNENYTQEMREMAKHAFETGLSYRFVAETLKIPLYTAREWQASLLRGELSWAQDVRTRKTAAVTDEEKLDFLEKIAAGELSVKAVARECGVCPSTVRYWRKTMRETQAGDAPPRPAFPSNPRNPKTPHKKGDSPEGKSPEDKQLSLF